MTSLLLKIFLVLAFITGLVGLVTACAPAQGGIFKPDVTLDPSQVEDLRSPAPTPKPYVIPTPRETPTPRPVIGVTQECFNSMQPLLMALATFHDRILTDISLVQYHAGILEVVRVYKTIPPISLDAACLDFLAVPAEEIMNEYIDAYNLWLHDEGNDAGIQALWTAADRDLTKLIDYLKTQVTVPA